MTSRKKGPEWFKFWRKNRTLLDIEQLSMESRGKVFTNIMRYFDRVDVSEFISLTPIEAMAYNILKSNADEAFADYETRLETNRKNGAKGGRPKKSE